MTQPKYVPIAISDEVRPAFKLEPPKAWVPHRPGEHRFGARLRRAASVPRDPDQGYALGLADGIFRPVVLGHGEHLDDALAAGDPGRTAPPRALGARRSAADLEFAFARSATDLRCCRPRPAASSVVRGAAHDDWIRRREVADLVPEDALRLGPAEAANSPRSIGRRRPLPKLGLPGRRCRHREIASPSCSQLPISKSSSADVLLLSGATFQVRPGDRIGLVGRNGAGKTTLARVLANESLPASGSIVRAGSVAYLPQDPRTGDLEVTVRDRVLSARGLDGLHHELARSVAQDG